MTIEDLYRFRAEEYERAVYSLREVEWKVTFQVISGYVLLAVAYWQARSIIPDVPLAAWWIAALTLLLWGTYFYHSLRLQERLTAARELETAYIKELHRILNAPELPLRKGVKTPKHVGYYAPIAQFTLSTAAMVSILVFIYFTRPM